MNRECTCFALLNYYVNTATLKETTNGDRDVLLSSAERMIFVPLHEVDYSFRDEMRACQH